MPLSNDDREMMAYMRENIEASHYPGFGALLDRMMEPESAEHCHGKWPACPHCAAEAEQARDYHEAEVAALRQALGQTERELARAIADLRQDDRLDDDLVGLSLVWIGGDELLDQFSAWYKPEDWPFGRHRAASAFLRERLATAEQRGREGEYKRGFNDGYGATVDIAQRAAFARGREQGIEEAAKARCRGCMHGWPWQEGNEEYHACPAGEGANFYRCEAIVIRALRRAAP